MTQHEGVYKLLNSKGEEVGTAYVEHSGPLSRWSWFAYVNGDTACNACLESGKQAFEELKNTVKSMVFQCGQVPKAHRGRAGAR
jgi:hypothetical protein